MKKKITLLGDSIRLIGYGTKLPELLGEDFTVFQPNENCRFSKYTLREVMVSWADGIANSDVIHWNNGLWDTMDHGEGVLTSEEEYVANMIRIAEILKKRAGKVIFATTTPVAPEYQYSNIDRIKRYNAILVPELEKRGIIINDMYSFVQPNIDTYIRKDDHIHLTKAGIWACAEHVKEVILNNL